MKSKLAGAAALAGAFVAGMLVATAAGAEGWPLRGRRRWGRSSRGSK